MNVKDNAKLIILLFGLYSLPIASLPSREHRFFKGSHDTCNEYAINRGPSYFMSAQTREMAGHEFIHMNATKWLGDKTDALERDLDAIDVNRLARQVAHKSIDAKNIDRKTDRMIASLEHASVDPKLLYQAKHYVGIACVKNKHHEDRQSNCWTDIFCCAPLHKKEEESETKEAYDRLLAVRNVGVYVINQRAGYFGNHN